MQWFERLQAKRRELGWSKRELHRRSDVPYDSVVKYLKGDVENPRGDIIDKLAFAVGVTALWLRYGVEEGQLAQLRRDGQNVPIVTLREVAAMGLQAAIDGARAVGRVTPTIEIMGPSSFAVTIEDDANVPILSIGDCVFCTPRSSPQPGALVVIKVNDQVLIRRYRVTSLASNGHAEAEFIPENPHHPTIRTATDVAVSILAVATHRVHKL